MYVSLSVLKVSLSRCVHGAGFDACIILKRKNSIMSKKTRPTIVVSVVLV